MQHKQSGLNVLGSVGESPSLSHTDTHFSAGLENHLGNVFDTVMS